MWSIRSFTLKQNINLTHMSTILCYQNALKENQTLSFTVDLLGRSQDIFLLKHDGEIKAFLNHCPHLGVPLNWQPNNFLSLERTHIQCATHGALFTLETGDCIAGPCRGQALTRLPISISDKGEIALVSE